MISTTVTQRRALMVVNPWSARARAADLEPFLRKLGESNIGVEIVECRRGKTPADVLVERATARHETIIVAGGDGTIRGAARALIALGRPVGVLPLGTANDLARGLGIPTDLVEAAAIIASGKTQLIDVAAANGELFFNSAGIGLGPALTKEMDSKEKTALGVLAYLKALMRAAGKHPSFSADIECDGRRCRLRVMQVTVANGRYYGGGMTASREARLDDSMLDLLAIKAFGLSKLLKLAPKLRWGLSMPVAEIVTERARHIQVGTRRRMQVTTDGELTTWTPVTFEVKPRALRVLVADGDAIDSRALDADAVDGDAPHAAVAS